MSASIRKKSPRAPSMSLDEAIEKASKIYDAERCHVAPADGVAQHIGYKSAANGAAISALASLRYFGLLERPRDGMIAVSKDVESYRFAPDERIRHSLVIKWLKSPPVFAELLDRYAETLPSDATLKFDLIQKGFAPAAADVCLQVFRRSVEFARYFEKPEDSSPDESPAPDTESSSALPGAHSSRDVSASVDAKLDDGHALALRNEPTPRNLSPQATNDDVDRIPIRLAGGRRAWIEIPSPFYEADKVRLKRQIDLLLTEDDEDDVL